MRNPRVDNKYNLKPKDIQRFVLVDKERLKEKPFWRNDVVKAYVLSEEVGDNANCTSSSYWIGFYDTGKIKLNCDTHEGMCSYNFKSFFDYKEIKYEQDLLLQERLLECMNWLLDKRICTFRNRNMIKSKSKNN